MTDDTMSNGGAGDEETSIKRVNLPAEVVENGPHKTMWSCGSCRMARRCGSRRTPRSRS
jgi:hypothetical protein